MDNSEEEIYSKSFFAQISDWSSRSANVIVPIIINYFHPTSVVDLGCGDGTWLNIFHQHGVKDILGVDRDYINGKMLKIPGEYFLAYDLNLPIALERKFDIANCLEVAEHLNPTSSEILVRSLTRLSDVVIFSAAVPFQPGNNHINLHWPEFWVSLFSKEDYILLNSLKYRIWDHAEVSFFYKQNILLFVNNSILGKSEYVRKEYERYRALPVSIIHPDLLTIVGSNETSFGQERRFSEIFRTRVKRRLNHMWRMLKKITEKKT